MTVRLGIVGAGAMGMRFAEAAAHLPGFEVTAIVDPDTARATALASEIGAVSVASVDELRGLADAVYLGVPHDLHESTSIAAARVGLHQLVDKPLATELGAAARIAAAAAASGRALMVGFSYRFRAEWRAAREWIESGDIGAPASIADSIFECHPVTPSWYWRRSSGGGVIHLQSHHSFDRAAWLLGSRIARVSCRARVEPGDEVETAVAISAESESGALLSTGIAFARDAEPHGAAITVVHGPLGDIVIDSNARSAVLHRAGGGTQRVDARDDDWLVTELKAFRAAIEGDSVVVPGVGDGTAALRCALASLESAAGSGGWVEVDMDYAESPSGGEDS